MTRDEAIRVRRAHYVDHSEEVALKWAVADVDSYVALGMLKLDEPKSAGERAVDAMFERGARGLIAPRHAIEAINMAGLKIVEK